MQANLTSVHSVHLPASAAQVYRWHTRPGAFERLLPPWERTQLRERQGTFTNQRVSLEVPIGPWRLTWVIRHRDVTPGKLFVDSQERGPFHVWRHERRFEPISDAASRLEDRIEYRLPGGVFGTLLAGKAIRSKIARLMEYRHHVLRWDLATHMAMDERVANMKVAVVGASGLIGSALVPFLTSGGHEVRRVGRRKPPGSQGTFSWDFETKQIEMGALEGADAVIHLAGENIGARWTEAKKRAMRASRVEATRFLCERLAAMERPPSTLVCASAIGYYGDRGDEELTERSSGGTGTLAELCADWEAAAAPAREKGIRVVHVRFGVVLSPRGGALSRMLVPFQLGAGGNLGNGRQFTSWIAIDDAVGILHRALVDDAIVGPVNAVSPQPMTNAAFTRTLGHVLKRPTVLPAPAFALRAMFGEMADEMLLSSSRVIPEKMLRVGYEFQHPTLEGALRHLLGRPSST